MGTSDFVEIFRGVLEAQNENQLLSVLNTKFRNVREFVSAQIFNTRRVGATHFFVEAELFSSKRLSNSIKQRYFDEIDDIFATISEKQLCLTDENCPAEASCLDQYCICRNGFTIT